MKTNNKGFTLIELLVVIAIITILATISIPQFAKYRVRAYNVVALSDLRNFKVDFEAFYTDLGNLGYPATLFTGMAEGWNGYDVITTAINDSNWNAKMAFLPSNRVEVFYDPSTNQQIYIVGTKHVNGTAVYASTSHTSRIYSRQSEDWMGLSAPATQVPMPTVTTGTGDESQNYKDSWFVTNKWTAL